MPPGRQRTAPPSRAARGRPDGGADGRFTVRRAGDAWLLTPTGQPADERALPFTTALAKDPENTVLVTDLSAGADDDTLKALARAVPPGQGGLRLVFGRRPAADPVTVARRIADLTDRSVTVAAGPPVPFPGGGLFVAADGWIRCAPGAPGTHDARRFPRPPWESALSDRTWSPGRTTVAEPIPSGVWLHAPGDDPDGRYRAGLFRRLRVSAHALTVVLGAPGAVLPPVADAARLWQDLGPQVRPAVRFLCHGPARLGGGRHFGEVLAQVLGEPVRVFNGTPQGTDESGDMVLTAPDGGPGRSPRALEFVHVPPDKAPGPSALSHVTAHRWPLEGLRRVRPGTYALTDDVVVEVVPSGLWLRLLDDPPHAADVRATEPDPAHERLLCDATSTEALPRIKELAEGLLRGFPPELRRSVRMGVCRPLTMAHGTSTAVPASERRRPSAGAQQRPGAVSGAVRPPDPGRRSSAGAPVSGPLRTEHEGLRTLAADILRRHPELVTDSADRNAAAAVAAVLRRLTEVPGADSGSQAPADTELLRQGLGLLPVYRGVTGLRATLDDAMRQWYAEQSLITDPAVCEASAGGPGDEAGDTDFLIWSVDGRRTDLLDPLCPDRILFLPGSRFRVLRPEPAVPDVVMMREIGPGQAASDERLDRDVVRELSQVALSRSAGRPG
ncbi:hypothetical protein GCM10010377_80740 [Streptomyces viridiviolaceus]|uniref:Uncharacterized protein n=1 Tax=Streptomyces viridiviolaceus TaxID=68282 RepID=A0ABW2EEV4_9ACTN|nr:hypothetical protein [Streptomyces viridiviolaceus]GHB78432.1 hypothetical protein GCM10010377_80740 [Streptomyces viridiviolaceus]